MNPAKARKALKIAREFIADDLENLLDSFTVGGPFGREKGKKPSKEGLAYAAPHRKALKAIDAALASHQQGE